MKHMSLDTKYYIATASASATATATASDFADI